MELRSTCVLAREETCSIKWCRGHVVANLANIPFCRACSDKILKEDMKGRTFAQQVRDHVPPKTRPLVIEWKDKNPSQEG